MDAHDNKNYQAMKKIFNSHGYKFSSKNTLDVYLNVNTKLVVMVFNKRSKVADDANLIQDDLEAAGFKVDVFGSFLNTPADDYKMYSKNGTLGSHDISDTGWVMF